MACIISAIVPSLALRIDAANIMTNIMIFTIFKVKKDIFSNLALDILGSFMEQKSEKREWKALILIFTWPPERKFLMVMYVYCFYRVLMIGFDVIDFGYNCVKYCRIENSGFVGYHLWVKSVEMVSLLYQWLDHWESCLVLPIGWIMLSYWYRYFGIVCSISRDWL